MPNAPILDMYFVCCGRWSDGNGLIQRINLEKVTLEESQNFSEINFYPYDSERIITAYKELKKKISRSIFMEKRVAFPNIKGIKQAFLGLVRCKDFVKLLSDVHCTVTAIRNSWLEVQLKTNDARNLGTIHISRIARKYIADIHNEAKIGDIFQAKIINDDYYENHWGWDLTKIF